MVKGVWCWILIFWPLFFSKTRVGLYRVMNYSFSSKVEGCTAKRVTVWLTFLKEMSKCQNSTSNILWPQRPQQQLCPLFWKKLQINVFVTTINIRHKSLSAIKFDPNLSFWHVCESSDAKVAHFFQLLQHPMQWRWYF